MPVINLKRNTIKKVPYKRDNQSLKYYNSKGWHSLRNSYYCSHPLCERCLAKGISRQAEDIHHIKAFLTGKTEEERWNLLLDPSNLMALCEHCHHEIHNKLSMN